MNKSTLLIISIIALSGLLGFLLSLYLHQNTSLQEETGNNIPITQTFHTPVSFVKQLAGDKDAGRKIFKEYCASCHSQDPIIDIKAPHIGDKSAWKIRKKRGLPLLFKTTLDGKDVMPARGGCFECSDDQLRETIQYMLNQSQ